MVNCKMYIDNIMGRARMTEGLHYAIGMLAERKESMNRVASLIEIGSSQAEYRK